MRHRIHWLWLMSALAWFLAAPSRALAQVQAELVASGLTQPVAFVQDPSNRRVQVIVQQDGHVRVLENGALQPQDFLDLSAVVLDAGEQGLLGLAFAPDYAASGRLFVNFVNRGGDTVVARFLRSAADPLRVDPSTRFDLLWPTGQRFIAQPFTNHKGGNLAFGPDGYLYLGMGDGGSADDPLHNAQNPLSLLGKMLRIDVGVSVADPEGYDVPPSNPFVGRPGIFAEIWDLGVRNPWRWSFDNVARGGTGALVIADVGQGAWEEIDYEPAAHGGRNYGWRNREGAHPNVTSLPPYNVPLTDPIFEYSHAVGHSITGGHVYRGVSLGSTYRGRYFYADFVDNRVWSLRLTVSPSTGDATTSDVIEHTAALGAAAASPASFGEDADGELYLVSYPGRVYRLSGTASVSSGGRRRPADVTPVGFAIPRSRDVSAPVALAINRLAAHDVSGAMQLFVALLNADPGCAVLRIVFQRDPIEPCADAVNHRIGDGGLAGGDGFLQRETDGSDRAQPTQRGPQADNPVLRRHRRSRSPAI